MTHHLFEPWPSVIIMPINNLLLHGCVERNKVSLIRLPARQRHEQILSAIVPQLLSDASLVFVWEFFEVIWDEL